MLRSELTSSAAILSSLPQFIDPKVHQRIAGAHGGTRKPFSSRFQRSLLFLEELLTPSASLALIHSHTVHGWLKHMNEMEQLRWNTNTEALQPNHDAVSREAEHFSVDISLAISSFSLPPSLSLSLWLQREASYGEITRE